jgi:amine acid ABC transporter, permease protein, 3-TM region, His/Glu/Gln/Arg/opine family
VERQEQPKGGRPAIVLAVALVALVLAGCQSSSYQYRWDFFVDTIIRPDPLIIQGLMLTVFIAIVSQVIGVVLGVFGALARMSRSPILRVVGEIYIWIFRGTPLLVQIMIIYFGLGVTGIYRFPDITPLGAFGTGAVQAGIIALGVNEGAYMSEIVRAGILSIDGGQMEAAKSLGMTFGLSMRRIILPQAARVIVPPLGNEFNNMLKTTSLLVIIGTRELYVTFSNINASGPMSFHPFELFLAAAIWYLLLTTIWGLIQSRIERRLGRGVGSDNEPSLRQRLFGRRFGASRDPSLVSGGR